MTPPSRSSAPGSAPVGEFAALDDLFHTRTTEFAFHRQRLRFDLARTVFSASSIDPGSALLLRHLQSVLLDQAGLTDDSTRPPTRVLDLGCGVGVLGTMLLALDPSRQVTFVDRDALACRYTRRNLAGNALDTATVQVHGSLGLDDVDRVDPFDLIVSNVPGKAGSGVLTDLIASVRHSASLGGLVALVVVKPLAAELETGLAEAGFEPVLRKGNKTHEVFISRVGGPIVPNAADDEPQPAFARGVYDRETTEFTAGPLSWTATTVVGLDEFDELATPTVLLRAALQGVPSGPSILVNPGQGHRAVIAARSGCAPAVLVARDLLALRASARCLVSAGRPAPDLVHDIGVPADLLGSTSVHIVHADDKTHGPWLFAEVSRYLDHIEHARASGGPTPRNTGPHHLVLTGRAGLLGRLEADLLSRRRGHVAHKQSRRGHRALRFTIS